MRIIHRYGATPCTHCRGTGDEPADVGVWDGEDGLCRICHGTGYEWESERTVPERNGVVHRPGHANPNADQRRPIGIGMAESVWVGWAGDTNPLHQSTPGSQVRLDAYSGDSEYAEHVGSAIGLPPDPEVLDTLAVRLLDVAEDIRRRRSAS